MCFTGPIALCAKVVLPYLYIIMDGKDPLMDAKVGEFRIPVRMDLGNVSDLCFNIQFVREQVTIRSTSGWLDHGD